MATDPTVPSPDRGGPSPDALLELCRRFALDAGRIVTELRAEAITTSVTKSSPTDPVTEADRAAEASIVEAIIANRPDDAIVGEEGANRAGTSDVTWHIDPIDGTTNYLYDYPGYAVSVAAEQAGHLAAGAVLNVSTGDLYSAAAGGGATCNDRALSTTSETSLAAALVGTGFSYQSDRRRIQAEVLLNVLPAVRDLRRGGSAALDLCFVASGRLDGYYEAGLNKWDYAAGWLIAEEAGGVCFGLDSAPPDERLFIAANGPLEIPLRTLLVEAGAERLLD